MDKQTDTPITGQWAIVELMGHKVVAGLVQKSELLGAALLRVDVPATSTYPAYSQFYGQAAIYAITFVSGEVAALTAEQCKVNPVSVYCPELIQFEKHQQIVDNMRETIDKLRRLKMIGSGREDDGDNHE